MCPAIVDREAAVGELARCRDLLAERGRLLGPGDGVGLAEEVMKGITFAIELLQVGADEAGAGGTAGARGARRKRNCREDASAAAAEQGEGLSKRRRRSKGTGEKITSTKLDDGFVWRKYGQKSIQNATYPRSYFRCTYKYSHGCQALKQVQQSESDSSLFYITYIGEHTCRDSLHVKDTHTLMKQSVMIDSVFEKQLQDNFCHYPDNISSQEGLLQEELLSRPVSPSLETYKILMSSESDVVSEQGEMTPKFRTPVSMEMDFNDQFFADLYTEDIDFSMYN